MAKIRIVFHDPRLSSVAGGGEVLTMALIRALDPSQFALTVVTRAEGKSPLFSSLIADCPWVEIRGVNGPALPRHSLAKVLQRKGIPVSILDDPLVEDAISFNCQAEAIIHSLDCDLISTSVLPDLFCLESAARKIFHIYGCPPPEAEPTQRCLLSGIHTFSTVSRYVAGEFSRLFQGEIQPDSIQHLAPGLAPIFSRPSSGAECDIDFLFVGRLRTRKGVDLILRASAILIVEHLPRLRVCIVGDGQERANLESLTASLGIERNVVFTGAIGTEPLIPYLDRSRWFLYPVRKPEAFGLAPLEAMARGVPPILGALGGMADYLVDGSNGWVLPEVTDQALAKCMRMALMNEDQRQVFAANGIRTAKLFSWDGFVMKVNRFYAQAAS